MGSGAPRLLKARRREGRIFTHSPSSSVSSFDSSSSLGSIIKAEFWIPPQNVVTIPADETKITPPTTPTTPKTKLKSKPANIIIPRNAPSATVVSPTAVVASPTSAPLHHTPVMFPTVDPSPSISPPEVVLCTSPPQTPLSPFLPLSPLSPNRRIVSPNARIRKIAKLTRTLGENVPIELVFPASGSRSVSPAPSCAPPAPVPAPAQKPTKRAKLLPIPISDSVTHIQRVLPLGPRTRPRPATPASPQWPLTPTPDCTINVKTHAQTAVGLHYALGMGSLPARAASPAVPHNAVPVGPTPTSPPPFSSVFTMDDVSWECARREAMTPRKDRKGVRALGGVRKVVDANNNGRGAWRKKENTWSGEWNIEDMEELQVRLRRLRRL